VYINGIVILLKVGESGSPGSHMKLGTASRSMQNVWPTPSAENRLIVTESLGDTTSVGPGDFVVAADVPQPAEASGVIRPYSVNETAAALCGGISSLMGRPGTKMKISILIEIIRLRVRKIMT